MNAEDREYKHVEGNIYEGEFKDGVYEGKGVMLYSDVAKYEGEFKNNKADGKGIYTILGGSFKYEGEFKNDNFHGKGIFKYEGEFKNDNFHGKGIVTTSVQKWNKYEGEVQNGKFNGNGILTYVNGSRYEGIFKNGDNKEGMGTFISVNGDKFTGLFSSTGHDFEGTMTYADGTVEKGKFYKFKSIFLP